MLCEFVVLCNFEMFYDVPVSCDIIVPDVAKCNDSVAISHPTLQLYVRFTKAYTIINLQPCELSNW